MEPIHFFRAGRNTTSDGRAIDFSQGDLQEIAAGYDPSRHEAPLVVGHPKTETPAFGWVARIAVKDDGLYAVPREVNPKFAELVKGGTYKKVSGSFYEPQARGNPTPGIHYLRHVGFLGGMPPSVKGLRPIQFAADDDGVSDFEEGLLDLREHRLGEAVRRHGRSVARQEVEKLAREAKIFSRDVEPLLSFMEGLSDEHIVEFSDTDGAVVREPHRIWFMDFLKRQLPFLHLGELANGALPDRDVSDFSTPQGYDVDPERAEMHQLALQYAKSMGTSYEAAARAVERGLKPREAIK